MSHLIRLMPVWHVCLADSGVGDSHAFYREQEHNPPRPWLPDPPAGVVRLWLPTLVSHPLNTILTSVSIHQISLLSHYNDRCNAGYSSQKHTVQSTCVAEIVLLLIYPILFAYEYSKKHAFQFYFMYFFHTYCVTVCCNSLTSHRGAVLRLMLLLVVPKRAPA